MTRKKLLAAVLLAVSTALPMSSANAFFGSWMPWDWGGPGYYGGYPGYWGGYPGYYGGYPGYWGGYPGYYGGYPGYGWGGPWY